MLVASRNTLIQSELLRPSTGGLAPFIICGWPSVSLNFVMDPVDPPSGYLGYVANFKNRDYQLLSGLNGYVWAPRVTVRSLYL